MWLLASIRHHYYPHGECVGTSYTIVNTRSMIARELEAAGDYLHDDVIAVVVMITTSLQYDVECVWCSFSALVWTVPCCTCRLLVIINWIININWTLYSQQNSTPYTYSIFEDWTNQRLTSIPYFNYSETVWTTEFEIRQSTSSKLLYLNPVLKAAHCYEKQLVPIVCMFIFLFRLLGLWTINSELLVYQQLKNVKLNPYNKLIK